jgi:hypothetical protein
MSRSCHEQPTPAELDGLKVSWTRGSRASVRDATARVNEESD